MTQLSSYFQKSSVWVSVTSVPRVLKHMLVVIQQEATCYGLKA